MNRVKGIEQIIYHLLFDISMERRINFQQMEQEELDKYKKKYAGYQNMVGPRSKEKVLTCKI